VRARQELNLAGLVTVVIATTVLAGIIFLVLAEAGLPMFVLL